MKISLPQASTLRRPEFIYGVATASFQIEGGRQGRLPCIWDTFCAERDTIVDGSNGDVACDHFNRWQEDLDLIESLNVDAYRFSISWPRVMHSDGRLNEEGVDFYIQILDRLNAKGIKPFVTLYHWDLPQHLEDKGGWLNRETSYQFRDYVDKITQAFGTRVYSYATLNEPFCSAHLGYELGTHAPGKVGKQYGKKAAHHLLLAHGLAMPVIEKNSPQSKNGIVLNFTPTYPKSNSQEDINAAKMADEHLNHWYIKPLIDGAYPDLLASLPEQEKPEIQPGDLEIIAQPLDYVGINYYTRAIYQANGNKGYEQEVPTNVPMTDMGWEIYPQGFTDLLVSMNQRYTLPPVYITENGAAMKDEYAQGAVNDFARTTYFNEHLNAVHQACEQGVNIQAYFAWSLMDNFEWAEGYLKRFGIVHVNYDSQARTIKGSGYAYRDYLADRLNIDAQPALT
jgi:beta-glucosidase